MSGENPQGECVSSGRALAPTDLDAMCIGPEQARASAIALLESEGFSVHPSVGPPEQCEIMSLEQAAELFGDKFLGPGQFENTFGFAPEKIPQIPFSEEILNQAQKTGMMLVLHVNQKNTEPMTMRMMHNMQQETLIADFNMPGFPDENFCLQTPRLGWRLISKNFDSNFTNKNIVEQLEEIVRYLEQVFFEGIQIPEEYRLAIAEFQAEKNDLISLMNIKNFAAVVEKIHVLQLSRLTLPTPVELSQVIPIYYKTFEERWLEDGKYARTSVIGEHERLVALGHTTQKGAWLLFPMINLTAENYGIVISLGCKPS